MKDKLIFIAFLLISLSSFAQMREYVVVTFESKRSIDKVAQNYYWITPIDSIKGINFYLYPLYVAEYSKDNLDNCQKRDTIDIFVSTDKTRFDFDENYELLVERLISLIEKNRIKVQTIKISWDKGKGITTNVYVTPVLGDFCSCIQYHNFGVKFKSLAYFPISNFSYIKSFWETPTASIVKFSDYNYIDYKSHLLYKKSGVHTGRN